MPSRGKSGALLTGLKLAQAQAWLRLRAADVEQAERDFIAASRSAARWREVRLWSMVATAPIVAALLVVIVWAALVWWGVRQIEAKWAADGEFVSIPGACFSMGSPETEVGRLRSEGPVHRVCLNSFYIARFEVTQGEWRRVMIGLAGFPNNPAPFVQKGSDRHPVEGINWKQAQRFIGLLSFFGRGEYRLPSEAEYEYAARAGTTASHYWGDSIDDGCAYENIADQNLKEDRPDFELQFAACHDGYGSRTAPVGSFKANPWGLYDMLGNVMTWTEDCYFYSYRETPTDGSPARGKPCVTRIIRGGSWNSPLRYNRAAARSFGGASLTFNWVGVRLLRTTLR